MNQGQHIPLTAGVVTVPLPALSLGNPPETWPMFAIKVPTFKERDTIEYDLVSDGIRQHSVTRLRQLMIAAARKIRPDVEAFEADRNFLEGFWQRADQEARDQLKMTDEERAAFVSANTEGDKEDYDALFDEYERSYPPLRAAITDNSRYDTLAGYAIVGRYVKGWENLLDARGNPVAPDLYYDKLKPENVELLRGTIGGRAWIELTDFITSLTNIDRDTEGNLDSLLRSMNDRARSPSPISPASSDGNDGEESTTNPPASSSEATADPSSSSTTSSGAKKVKSKDTPTAAA